MSQENTTAAIAEPRPWHTPKQDEILICPVGGVRKIGMNMTLYGTAGRYLIVDAGIAFMPPAEAEATGIRAHSIAPETLEDNFDCVDALIVTHGHEDHIGGVLDILLHYDVPVYLTPLADQMLRRKAREIRFPYPIDAKIFSPGDEFRIGRFLVATCPVSHSIPEACSLFIVADGVQKGILHTGDYNMDQGNALGTTDEAWLKRLGDADMVGLVVGDSTNAAKETDNASEAEVALGLEAIMRQAEGGVYVVSFGSNICRVINAHKAALAAGRTLAIAGTSMLRMTSMARNLGYGADLPEAADRCELDALPRQKRAMIMTGIQGETYAALGRMLDGAVGYPDVRRGDVIVLSGRTIGQNRPALEAMLKTYRQLGVTVLESWDQVDGKPLHASGHASRNEIISYYRLARPEIVMPVHGEPEHMAAHADIARSLSLRSEIPQPGDVFRMNDAGLTKIGQVTPAILAHREDGGQAVRIPSLEGEGATAMETKAA